jgi:hypothetical protein
VSGAGSDAVLTTRVIVGQLASPTRLRVVAALTLGARTPSQIADRAQLSEDEANGALTRLLRAGLITVVDGEFVLREHAFADAVRAETPPRSVPSFGPVDAATSRVLRAYFHDGRLTAIPAPGRKRRMVLEYLATAFEPGRRYDESNVNATLRDWHEDVAALRRYLVEAGLLSRAKGEYWRTGGWVDVSE